MRTICSNIDKKKKGEWLIFRLNKLDDKKKNEFPTDEI